MPVYLWRSLEFEVLSTFFVILQRLYVGLYNEKIMDLALKYIFQGCKTVNSDFKRYGLESPQKNCNRRPS